MEVLVCNAASGIFPLYISMGGLFLIPSSCSGSLEWICFSWCKLWKYWQGGRKRERDNCHWSKISWEVKIILHQICTIADLQHSWRTPVLPPALSHSAEPEGCPVFSLKAQREQWANPYFPRAASVLCQLGTWSGWQQTTLLEPVGLALLQFFSPD